jgi:F-type H+-transporting ATPase subunit delta
MKDVVTAKAYAKALLQMSQEGKSTLVEEIVQLTELINKSNQLENVLFLEIFTVEEKKGVFAEIAKKAALSPVLVTVVNYIIEEKRLNLLPLITKELVIADDDRRGFLKGTIEGAGSEVDPKLAEQIGAFLKKRLGHEAHMHYVQNPNISAGYRVTVDDLQLDASLDNQLEQFKKSVISE